MNESVPVLSIAFMFLSCTISFGVPFALLLYLRIVKKEPGQNSPVHKFFGIFLCAHIRSGHRVKNSRLPVSVQNNKPGFLRLADLLSHKEIVCIETPNSLAN